MVFHWGPLRMVLRAPLSVVVILGGPPFGGPAIWNIFAAVTEGVILGGTLTGAPDGGP